MAHRGSKVGTPSTEVVVDVNHRQPGLHGTAFEGGEPGGHRLGLTDQCLGAIERHVVDDVYEDESGTLHGNGDAPMARARPSGTGAGLRHTPSPRHLADSRSCEDATHLAYQKAGIRSEKVGCDFCVAL